MKKTTQKQDGFMLQKEIKMNWKRLPNAGIFGQKASRVEKIVTPSILHQKI